MSRTTLPNKVVLQVWLRAGGRCQYPGCNDALWKDALTLREMNCAYLAHIIADSPDGPRGDPTLSQQLKADASNIMLLCDTHHRTIDLEDVAGHPVELLRSFKWEHEERIERQTSIQAERRTHLLLFGTNIGDRHGLVNYEQACAAVLPERYPAEEHGFRLDLADNEISERDPEFWDQTGKFVERRLRRYLAAGVGLDGKPLNHLSVFALAPIPSLIHLGMQLGDIVSADVYQRQRSSGDWQWQRLENETFAYTISRPGRPYPATSQVAVNLSLSGTIGTTEIECAMGEAVPIYKVTVGHPHRDFLRSKEQLELFRNEWYRLLAEIREAHGRCVRSISFRRYPARSLSKLAGRSSPRAILA